MTRARKSKHRIQNLRSKYNNEHLILRLYCTENIVIRETNYFVIFANTAPPTKKKHNTNLIENLI